MATDGRSDIKLQLPAAPISAPQSKPTLKQLWEVFPAYSLSRNFGADKKLVTTLKGCYASPAIRMRTVFLTHVRTAEEAEVEQAKRRGEQYPMCIADDLFERAGNAFEAHLRNCSSSDLRLLMNRERDERESASLKLSAFFKPRSSFESQSWETMRALLSRVWDWAEGWRLNHYVYVHFACLALIEGHWLDTSEPVEAKAAAPFAPSIAAAFAQAAQPPAPSRSEAPDPRRSKGLIHRHERTPSLGWGQAKWSLESSALADVVPVIPSPLGFPPYFGGRSDAADSKEARKKYKETCERDADEIIRSTLLASLGATMQAEIIAKIGAIARRHSERVDKEYNRRGETPPGRIWMEYERNLKWTVQQVIFRRDWLTIARKSRAQADKVRKAVRKTLDELYLPYILAKRKRERKKAGE